MKVYVNRTIDPETVSLFSAKTGEFTDRIPSVELIGLKAISEGVFEVTRKKINQINKKRNDQHKSEKISE